MELIDFTNCIKTKKAFNGANGAKFSIVFNNEYYMLKFPSYAKFNSRMHYSNSVNSEFISCKILKSLKLNVQDVLIGVFKTKKKIYNCVACRDFARNGWVFQDFASIRNQIVDSETNGANTNLNEILDTIDKQKLIEPEKVESYFWDLFVADAFIGNWDRHNGNWGFLYHEQDDQVKLAPIFDCGSSLYPQADKKIMLDVLQNKQEAISPRIYDSPYSAIKNNNQRIKYYDFLTTYDNKNLGDALSKFQDNFNALAISNIVANCSFCSDLQKQFYIKMLNFRKEKILDVACEVRNISINKEKNISIDKQDDRNAIATEVGERESVPSGREER